MIKQFIPAIILLSLSASIARAQTALTSANYVTEVVTNYQGYWRSGNGTAPPDGWANAAKSTTKPDNSHLLLAFVVNSGVVNIRGTATKLANKYFSTGVNDALLTSKGLAYNACKYQALPVSALSGTVSSQTKVALGQLYDGIDNGASSPPPAGGYAQYLTDGTQGLDLGTGTANLPAGTLTFSLSGITASALNDGVPDILITQIASPTSVVDSYRFLDGSGNLVSGTRSLSANFNNSALIVGSWTVDFYEASKSPMTLESGFTKTDRDLRLLAADLSEFGVTSANINDIRQFEVTLSGDSDQAFIAYNTAAVTLQPLPVQLVRFEGQAQGRRVRLSWETASELNSAWFEVEASADGHAWAPVGRVLAAGTSSQAHRYAFEHQPAGAGLGYYRLHQLDQDGTGTYSPTVAVRTGAAAVEVFPNPATTALTVQLPATAAATLTLLAADGRPVWQQQLRDAPAQQLLLPALASLPPGLYLLRAELDGQVVLRRVVKE